MKVLNTCETFNESQQVCRGLKLDDISGTPICISQDRLSVDHQAIAVYPYDVPCAPNLIRVTVRTGGDCLSAYGSTYAFGHDGCPNEIRVRM